MSDPKRWLDEDGGATQVERELLRGALDADPPQGKKAALWASIVGRLPVAGGGGGGGGGGAGGAASGGGGVLLATKGKVVVAVVATLLAVGTAVTLQRRAAPMPPAAALPTAAPAATTPANALAPVPALSAAVPAAAPIANTAPEPVTDAPAARPTARGKAQPTPAPAPIDQDALREEASLIARARDALRSGDAAGALSTLESARGRFPRGVLVQERNVLTIEALAASGDRDAASRQAQVFLRQFPTSPLASRVRPFVR